MKNIFISLSIVCLGFGLTQCDRDTTVQGPLLDNLFGEFAVIDPLTASTATVDFSASEQVIFNAEFNKEVDWEVHIIGQESGGKHIISGFSNVVNETNAVWNGSTTELPMFKMEMCSAALIVNAENFSSDTLQIDILGTKTTTGFVVADFESGINPGWSIFAQSGANMSFRIVEDPIAGQGDFYYDMGGEVSFDFLIGRLDFPASAYQQTYFPLSSNENNVFFNVFLYKPAGINNEIILFRFEEDDNEDGIFQANNEDTYSIELRGLDVGWQLVSVRYSDLVTLVNGQPAAPAGNGNFEPHKILNVSLLFLADPSSGYCQTYLDNMVFTENQPFQP